MSAPLLRVLKGQPSDDELVAVVLALVAATSDDAGPSRPPTTSPGWTSAPGHRVPGAWTSR
ncbi:acyl-CoA carboxylase epsilon subunit [Actinosynnema sp. NPDC023794]